MVVELVVVPFLSILSFTSSTIDYLLVLLDTVKVSNSGRELRRGGLADEGGIKMSS